MNAWGGFLVGLAALLTTIVTAYFTAKARAEARELAKVTQEKQQRVDLLDLGQKSMKQSLEWSDQDRTNLREELRLEKLARITDQHECDRRLAELGERIAVLEGRAP